MALSNVPTVKRALYDALQAATYTDPQPGVWYSDPNLDHQYYDNIVVAPGDTPVRARQEWVTIGAGAQRSEDIEIPVLVEVFRSGTDAFDADDRVWELAEAIATVLHGRPFPEQVLATHPTDFEQVTGNSNDGRLARLTLTVSVSSRISGI
jgi:hypothetical protein